MSKVKVSKGNTLLLHGPASAILIEGKASVLGCPLSSRRRLIVKSWRSRPIYAEEDSVIDVAYGEGGGFEIVEGDTIPSEWRSFAEKASERPSCVCVYGGVDSGKTSLATLIANNIVRRNGSAIYLDLDLGQSNICPPTTVGYTILRMPCPDISYHRMEFGEIVGYTSPTPIVEKHIEAVRKLMSHISEKYPGIGVSADFDGWTSGIQALKHKEILLSILRPSILAAIGDMPDELRESCEKLGIEYEILPPPRSVRKRPQEARKRLREIAYERFLRKAIVRKMPISWVRIRTTTGLEGPERIMKHIQDLLLRYSEYSGEILDETIDVLEELAKKKIGVLSYLRDPNGAFSGIGLLTSFDPRRNYFRILTPYDAQIGELIIGTILLSVEGEEVYAESPLNLLKPSPSGKPA